MDSEATTASALPKSATLKQRRNKKQSANSVAKPAPLTKQEKDADADPSAKSKQPVVPPSPRTAALLPVALTSLDVVISVSLFLLALAIRGYRLVAIDRVIFDEVHYFNFTNHILRREYFFDVNPVFGKVILAFIAKVLGYDETFDNVNLNDQLISAQQGFAARFPAALLGSLTIPIFYRVARLLHLSTYGSVLAAFFILFDTMHIIQSRIIMVDAVLVFFTCLSLLCALHLWHEKNLILLKKGRDKINVKDVAYIVFLLVVTGISCGLTASVRWTAFATPLLIFIISFFGVGPFCLKPLNELELLLLYGSAFLSYCGSFAIFLLTCNQTGPGDEFMSAEFQACIVGNKYHIDASSCKMNLLRRVFEVNAVIYRYSKGIRGKDAWGSSWFHWIFNWRGALYYREAISAAGQDEKLSMVYLLMNPMMTLSIDAFMGVYVLALFLVVRYRKYFPISNAFKQHLRRGGVMFFGWILSMLPTMVVYRSGPVYQYLPGLFFAQALAAIGFDLIPRQGRPFAMALITTVLVVAFIYWSPWVYGTPISHAAHLKRRWLPKWD